jgi:CRISPR-associated endonuclease/helicase Cas3
MKAIDGRVRGPWGKLVRSGGAKTGPVEEWHPLAAHCADVAACAEALLRRTILGRRLARLAACEQLDEATIARLSLLAALHDVGKPNAGFQRKGDENPQNTAGHVQEILDLISWSGPEAQAIRGALAFLDGWGGPGARQAGLQLLIAAICHHGRPIKPDRGKGQPRLWQAGAGREPLAWTLDLIAQARRWFPEADATDAPPLPRSAEFQHAFEGLVMLADWIGSDRRFFPFAEESEGDDRLPFARRAAATAMRDLGLDVSAARATLGGALAPPGFERVSSHAPREAQRRVVELPLHSAGSLTILESETGSGKTEAALARFLVLLHAGLVDGLTFALPTRTAATQIHRRIVAAVGRAFGSGTDAPPVVLAVPGYLRVDDATGRRLPGFEVLWNDENAAAMRHRGWAAENSKRFLAGAIVVGTIDQVLLSALRVGHAHLRATALLRHLLVVDEVHASDFYMSRILEEVLRFHAKAGGHSLLMSATLGTAARSRLSRAAGGGWHELELSEAVGAPYPAIHDGAVGDRLTTLAVAAPGLPKTVAIETDKSADDPAAIAGAALHAARAGARVLVLRNTVRDALETQAALEALAEPGDESMLFHVGAVRALHHARFARDDRGLLDDAVEARLGENAPAAGGCVVVATQTVQQALDLDADWMLTDLAPMDVLLQRLGRVHRHRTRDVVRPAGFREPRVRVLVSEAPLAESLKPGGEARGAHGVGTVYADVVILQATLDLLEERPLLRIPEDNRELVERTTHPEALSACAERLGGVWLTHLHATRGVRLAQIQIGGLGLIDRSKHLGDYEFPSGEMSEQLSTRLGEGDRRVVFLEPPTGPFGRRVAEITLTSWMVKQLDTTASEEATDVQTDGDGGIRFGWGGGEFVYDRWGVRKVIGGTQPEVVTPTAEKSGRAA